MESLLKVEVKKKQSIDVEKNPLSMKRSRGTSKFAFAIQSCLKRKQAVEPDANESDLDDLNRNYYAPQITSQKRRSMIDSDPGNGSVQKIMFLWHNGSNLQQSCRDKLLAKHDQANNLTDKDDVGAEIRILFRPTQVKDDNHFRSSKE